MALMTAVARDVPYGKIVQMGRWSSCSAEIHLLCSENMAG